MATFKKTTSVSGSFKNLIVQDGKFVDEESGEIIDVAGILANVYGSNAFELKTSFKSDMALEGSDS